MEGETERVKSLKPSKTLSILDQAIALQQAGAPVISLAIGEPDFHTPPAILEVGHNNIIIYVYSVCNHLRFSCFNSFNFLLVLICALARLG